ncbi:EamA family transporter, partial [Rhodobacter sp. NTK016B]|nr:EamA family transporter [Rhodobacter sp. NTK016B]
PIWGGLVIALFGLIYLVLPGLASPPVGGSALMIISGIAWGFYSLLGRGSAQPVANTMNNFVRAVPFALGVSLVNLSQVQLSGEGVLLAVLSG